MSNVSDVSYNLNKIFGDLCDYNTINTINNKKLRKKGISLENAFLYRMLYSDKNTTKEGITSKINSLNQHSNMIAENKTSFTRQAYEYKERNISLSVYESILNKIVNYYNIYTDNNNNVLFIAVDGVCNNDIENQVVYNLGFFNITNCVPIDINYLGKDKNGQEVSEFKSYLSCHMDEFKNCIFVADGLYFKYNLLDFLESNNLKYIIRTNGPAEIIDPTKPFRKQCKNKELVKKLREHIRVVRRNHEYNKTVYECKNKKLIQKHVIRVKSDCNLVTNLVDHNVYSDDYLLSIYKSRWDIEIFYKYLKNNFKFQNMPERDLIQCKKLYICELILAYLQKILEQYYTKNNKDKLSKKIIKKENEEITYTKNINHHNLLRGIFDELLYDMIHKKTNNQTINKLCNIYIKIITNKTNRYFTRIAKKTFSKWHFKGSSDMTKLLDAIRAIINGTVNELNENIRRIAKKIISVDGKIYN